MGSREIWGSPRTTLAHCFIPGGHWTHVSLLSLQAVTAFNHLQFSSALCEIAPKGLWPEVSLSIFFFPTGLRIFIYFNL